MSFPRYLEYKDSGVEWLGKIPKDWIVVPIKRLGRLKGGAGFPHNEQGVEGEELDFHKVGALGQSASDGCLLPSENTVSFDTAEKLGAFVFPAGTLVFAKVGAALFLGRIRKLGRPACIDNNMMGFVVSQECYEPAFVRYAMGLVRFDLLANPGAVPSLNEGQIGGFALASPRTKEEQAGVASFLDRETAKIDALVAEQEQLITLLKEKRQAVISHAVTKGLDPSVPMKDSGVEWLGEVPAHWAVGKCGFYIRILSGFAFPSSGFSQDEANHRLLRGANVGVSRLKWDDTVYWERSDGDGLDEYEMSEGDLVIGMDRPLISEGIRVAKVTAEDLPSLLLQRVASLKVGPKLHADYLHHLLSSEMFIAHFSPETTGVSVPHISPDQINNFVIPVPPIDEQRAIVEHLSNLTTSYSRLINEGLLSIELLRERRSALISAAVTGQIDVRGLAPAQEQAA